MPETDPRSDLSHILRGVVPPERTAGFEPVRRVYWPERIFHPIDERALVEFPDPKEEEPDMTEWRGHMTNPYQVPYGTTPPRRFTFWQRHGARLLAAALFATGPLMVVHLLLCPLWILPALNLAWGDFHADEIAGGTAFVHVVLLVIWGFLTLGSYISRARDGHWPWEKKDSA